MKHRRLFLLSPIIGAFVALCFFFAYCVTPYTTKQPTHPSEKQQQRNTADRQVRFRIDDFGEQADLGRLISHCERLARELKRSGSYWLRTAKTGFSSQNLDQLAELLHQVQRAANSKLSEDRAKISALGLPPTALDRHASIVSRQQSRFDRLWMLIDGLRERIRALNNAAIRGNASAAPRSLEQDLSEIAAILIDEFGALTKKVPRKLLNPTSLPTRMAAPETREPRTRREEFSEFRKPVQVASLSGGFEFVLAQADPEFPVAADLGETPEVEFTSGLQELASSLNHAPVEIYNWVRRNVLFVPTFGSIQGAEGCRLSRECNAHDMASLLIALLRISGTPARYGIGTIELPTELYLSSMGDFEDVVAADRLARGGGIPTLLLRDPSGLIEAVRFEHVWVEAFVDYLPSRGKEGNNPGTWIPMDAALKDVKYSEPRALLDGLNIDPEAAARELVNASEFSGNLDSILVSSVAAIEGLQAQVEARVDDLAASSPDATVSELTGAVTIEASTIDVLPSSLPGRLLTIGSRSSELPDSARHAVEIEVSGGFSHRISLPALGKRRMTLAYVPADESDAATIDAFGGVYETPPYLVSLRPVLYIGGEPVAVGSPAEMGSTQILRVAFEEPGGTRDQASHLLTVGSFVAIVIERQSASRDQLEARKEVLTTALDRFLADEEVHGDDLVGELLNLQGRTYFGYMDFIAEGSENRFGVRAIYRPRELLSSFAPSFDHVFDTPIGIGAFSFGLDVQRNVGSVVSRTGDKGAEAVFAGWASAVGSGLEREVLQSLHLIESVSTTRVLNEAAMQGIPLLRVDSGNLDQVLSQLLASDAVVEDVKNAVSAGNQVLIPAQSITLFDWTGTGFVVAGPDQQSFAYVISGGLNGGLSLSLNGQAALLPDVEIVDTGIDMMKDFSKSLRYVGQLVKYIGLKSRILEKILPVNNGFRQFLKAFGCLATFFDIWQRTGDTLAGITALGINKLLSALSLSLQAAAQGAIASFLAALYIDVLVGVPSGPQIVQVAFGFSVLVSSVIVGALVATLNEVILTFLFPPGGAMFLDRRRRSWA